ncbi:hypothetical protein DERF_006974 [Dermatophagoides farinae]|uniref:Uncharacterized protein n=1 Tax=Dermatophagoides farinae TaxID=6954 RepID=A0A922L417_DERFA|nr:hypothetical protein DERF_006974 [Dermatophagoides farinae]
MESDNSIKFNAHSSITTKGKITKQRTRNKSTTTKSKLKKKKTTTEENLQIDEQTNLKQISISDLGQQQSSSSSCVALFQEQQTTNDDLTIHSFEDNSNSSRCSNWFFIVADVPRKKSPDSNAERTFCQGCGLIRRIRKMYRLKLIHIDEYDPLSTSSSSQSRPKVDLYICRDCGFYNLKTKTFEYYWLSDADESDIDEQCVEINMVEGDYCDQIDNKIVHNDAEIITTHLPLQCNNVHNDNDEKESINLQSSDGSHQNDEFDSCQYV